MLQASFDPPGLSIAVKKDRAMETLLANGNKFNVNVLAQGNEKVCAVVVLASATLCWKKLSTLPACSNCMASFHWASTACHNHQKLSFLWKCCLAEQVFPES